MAKSFLILILFSLVFTVTSSQQVNERESLLQIKKAWGNPPSLSSWNATTPIPHCNWTGIQCDNPPLVTAISLSSFGLSFPIPADLICSNLTSLSYLDLSLNLIPGTFPSSLNKCTNLTYLDLSQNNLIGELPNINISTLTYLELSYNNFTGDVPQFLSPLKTLMLDNNLFNGDFPSHISNLSSSLTFLSLAYSAFRPSSIPPGFGKLNMLTYLWMSSTNILGDIPDSFANLTQLQHLDLAMNNITGVIPAYIWGFKNLEYLYLYKNKFVGEINAPVEAAGLVGIDVSINNLTGSIPEDFGTLKNLSVLFMYFNEFSGTIPESIGLLPSLTDLRLFNNGLTGALPSELGRHSMLWNLEVDDNLLSGQLPEYLCANGALASLVVFDNNFTGNIPASLGECNTSRGIFTGNIQLYRNNFSGDLPRGIWSAQNLTTVMVRDNNLSGVLPDKLPWNLTRLDVENNAFSGKVPSSGGNLVVFLAGNNLFSGDLPSFAGMPRLQSLSLGGNLITGEIPQQDVMSLRSLTDLNLSSNQLAGQIPSWIGLLSVLTILDLSSNALTGEIPPALGNLNLNFLNLSVNQLSGQVPVPLQNAAYGQSFRSNRGLCSGSSELNLPSCGKKNVGSGTLSSKIRTLLLVLGALFLAVSAMFAFFVARDYRQRKARKDPTSWKITPFRMLDFNESNILRSLTEENLIGSGGGGKVYGVRIGNTTGSLVAVKKIWNSRKVESRLEREFQSEVCILGSIKHANIVPLLCCISSNECKLLVYEYMANGSLDRWLHKRRNGGVQPMVLDWPRRLGIAIGAAYGLSYMHHDCSPPIVHRDVKSSNILLDTDFRARIADFGLARILVRTGEPCTVSAVAGSFGYMAPECAYASKVNEKMDVYSFGVVLLELTTGREAHDGGEYGGLADWAWRHFQDGNKATDAIDKAIKAEPSYLDDIVNVLKLGLICTGTLPSTRPTMKEVVQILVQFDRTSRNGGDKLQQQRECDEAPLLQTKKDSRSHSRSKDSSGLASNV